MIRSITYPELSDWIKQPIHTGSIYIKPTESEATVGNALQSCCSKCFAYFHYFFCYCCIYDN